ncbi:hypothetical protein Tco_0855250 [Tanacetum coccineum]
MAGVMQGPDPDTGEVTIAYDDPIIIEYIGMPTYSGRMNLSEETTARLSSQPIRPSDMDLSKIKLPKNDDGHRSSCRSNG